MFPSSDASLMFLFASIQAVGLMSLCFARMTGSSFRHCFSRRVFLCALVAVGAATIFAVGCNNGWWVSCGATLAVMSIGGTIDLGQAVDAVV